MVYHYCTMSTFLSIIQNKTLRLSNVLKSNDSREMRWLMNALEPIYDSAISKLQAKSICENVINELRTLFRYDWDSRSADNYLPLAICFSEKEDALSQWRGYADDGKGICIGISCSALKSLISPENHIRFKKVHYLDQDKIREKFKLCIEEAIDKAVNSGYLPIQVCDEGQQIEKIMGVWTQLNSNGILQDAIFIKNPFFQEEEEWRLVKMSSSDAINNSQFDKDIKIQEQWSYHLSELSQNVLNSQIVEYVDLDYQGLKMKGKPFIEKVIIGSKAEVSKRAIESILTRSGFDIGSVEIVKSKGSYR